MKTRFVTFEQLRKIYKHPSAVLFRYLELKTIYEKTKDLTFETPSLDLGCGDGEISELLFDTHFTYGVDNGEANDVDIALKLNRYQKIYLESAESMSIPDSSLRFVFSNSVLEHIPNNEAVLSETYRILQKGGKFVFTSPSNSFTNNLLIPSIFDGTFFEPIAAMYKRERNKMLNHYHLCSRDEYTRRLTSHGFKIDAIYYCISPRTVRLWDKMAILIYIGRIFGFNLEDFIYKMYESDIEYLIKNNKESNETCSNLLVIATKA